MSTTKLSYKEYLAEYEKYFNSFSEVVNNKEDDDEVTKKDSSTRNGSKAQQKQIDRKASKIGDGKEGYDPCKFRQWMELSIAGD